MRQLPTIEMSFEITFRFFFFLFFLGYKSVQNLAPTAYRRGMVTATTQGFPLTCIRTLVNTAVDSFKALAKTDEEIHNVR